jgi:hypothetical protein
VLLILYENVSDVKLVEVVPFLNKKLRSVAVPFFVYTEYVIVGDVAVILNCAKVAGAKEALVSSINAAVGVPSGAIDPVVMVSYVLLLHTDWEKS